MVNVLEPIHRNLKNRNNWQKNKLKLKELDKTRINYKENVSENKCARTY
jgi:hypothetical protein